MQENFIRVEDFFSEISTKNIDTRKRIAIGDALKAGYSKISRFKIFGNDNGDVLLRPVVEIPAREAWLYKNKKALKAVEKGLKQSAEGKVRPLKTAVLAAED